MRLIVAILASVLALLVVSTASATTASQKLRKSETVIAWYEGKGAWHLRPGYAKCSQIRSEKAAGRCYRHRQGYRFHRERAERLTPKPTIAYLSAWLCIHAGEGAWNANTGNGYYGGLQMDWSFMSTYGPELLRAKGTADNWTPAEQMMVAERAVRTRGFHPWPNTARRCGLI